MMGIIKKKSLLIFFFVGGGILCTMESSPNLGVLC